MVAFVAATLITMAVPRSASARTPTPTDGPAPTSTQTPSVTATGTLAPPFVNAYIAPNPARGGQRVLLDGTANVGTPHWSQVSGPAVAIEQADMLMASFVAPLVAARAVVVAWLELSTIAGVRG